MDAAEPIPITFDLPCAECGYNLRGLTTRGGCPECGSAVLVSIYDDSWHDDAGGAVGAIREELELAPLRPVAAADGVAPEGVRFVRDAMRDAADELRRKLGMTVPLTAGDICRQVRTRVRWRFDVPEEARARLDEWGLRRGEDVGRVVLAMVSAGQAAAQPGDSADDFAGLFSADAAGRYFE